MLYKLERARATITSSAATSFACTIKLSTKWGTSQFARQQTISTFALNCACVIFVIYLCYKLQLGAGLQVISFNDDSLNRHGVSHTEVLEVLADDSTEPVEFGETNR